MSIIDFRYSGSKETALTLEGEFGERLEVHFGLIHDPRGEFRAAVERCLQPIRDRRLKEPRWRERSSYPLRVPAVTILFFGLMLCGFGGGVLLDPQIVPDSLAERIGTGLFYLCGGLVPILLGINSFTYRISVRTDAIETDSLFRHRHLPYARIDEFLSRTATGEGEPTRFTTLIGAGQQIWFSDSIPDYARIRDYIVSRIDPQAVVRGEAGLPARIARESKRGNTTTTLFVSICIGLMIGIMAWIKIVPAQQWLARQIRLDAHGVSVAGHITRVRGPEDEDSRYYVDYAFPARGETQTGHNSVAQSVYVEARHGQPIAITYLPDDPTINRSTYTRRIYANSVYPTWYRLFVLTGFCPPLFTAFALFAKARPRRTASVYCPALCRKSWTASSEQGAKTWKQNPHHYCGCIRPIYLNQRHHFGLCHGPELHRVPRRSPGSCSLRRLSSPIEKVSAYLYRHQSPSL